MLKSWICSLFLVAASFLADEGAQSSELAIDEVHAVRATVEGQLQAFAKGDAALAFSFAAPELQRQFQDAATFAVMVRNGYPMLVHPASVSFDRPELEDGVVIQAVRFRDAEGRYWRAFYQLQRQPDKHWRIGGCAVAADDDASMT
ncbi:MAG TPA: DUF4864 domain-containing protein [Burkholderiaceae bacterium]